MFRIWARPDNGKKAGESLDVGRIEKEAEHRRIELPAVAQKRLIPPGGKMPGKERFGVAKRRFDRLGREIGASRDVAVDDGRAAGKPLLLGRRKRHVRLAQGLLIQVNHFKRLKLQDAELKERNHHDGRVAENNFRGTPILQTNQEKNGGVASKSNQPKANGGIRSQGCQKTDPHVDSFSIERQLRKHLERHTRFEPVVFPFYP